jgi:2-keto-4-pentenoate hydratase/2-oxohepta-3-ene-1,7-dioic acid hydratase in catechol pathway
VTEKYFLRFKTDDYEGAGILVDKKIHPIKGDMYSEYEIMDKSYSPDEIIFLPPCTPQKIICVGLNYADHADESTLDAIPEEPLLFFKPTSSLIGHRDKIIKPGWVDRVDYEGEIAVIIGKTMRYVNEAEAQAGIFGYTCVNDVTARNMQKKDKQWTRPKGFDTFCPVGPYIATGIDASSLSIQTRLNGKVVQQGHTSMMMRQPAEVISYISKVMTLYPGDIISTGTPRGVGPLNDGDIVEIEIEKIGTLSNTVSEDKQHA